MSQHPLGLTIAGKYQIKRLLGEGGMGAVYEGLHLEIGKRVAIKTISVQRAHSDELAMRFKREARTASAVESENIVQVFDVGQDPQVGLYMVMEHLAGEDLATRLRRAPPLEAMTALVIFAQALHGLEKAHAAGIVHRDLKPANLFLVDRGTARLPLVKILDFGISKVMRDGNVVSGNTGASLVTRAGAVMGTALYMSPEQAQGAGQVDQRADIWAMGAVLYEIFAGRTPYEQAATYEAMIVKIVTTQPTPLLQIAPDVPPPLAAVIHQALKHDVSEHITDCATFLRLLDGAVPGAVSDWLGRRSAVGTAPNLGSTAGVDPCAPRPATPMRASFDSRGSLPNPARQEVALTTSAGSAMVTPDRPSRPRESAPPSSRRASKRVVPLVVAGVSLVIALAAVTTTLLRGHDRGASTAAAAAQIAAPSPPPVVTQAAPPPPPAVAPSASASVVAPSASAPIDPPAKPARRSAAPKTAESSAPTTPAPAPAPSSTGSRQFGGVDMSDTL